ncbi:Receptor-like protein EIX2 [Glycine soja]
MNTLLRFKTGVTDPSGVLSSWFPKLDCCQWTGVKCDNITGRVTHLNLPCHTTQPKVVSLDEKDDKSHCLTGEFSLTLLELEFLSYLDFSNNDFKSIQYNSMGSQKCDQFLKIHCNEKDMNTLLRFKKGVRDPSGMLSSWFPKLDCCRWTGVKCDNITGRVTQLNLPCHTTQPEVVAYQEKDDKSHCLTGEFSLTLLELEFLSYLDFSNNDFKSIQYSSMGNHKCDDLSRGNLPHLCGNSTNLHYLDLSHNYDLLVYNLHWVSRLSSLKYLNLGGVRLPKEIDWLQSVTMLPSLLELTLENCQLENIYPFLQYANFTSLQVLNLAGNDFVSELPSWLFNLSCDISHIDLSQNRINSQLPERFPNFRSIQTFFLSDNYLKGPIPNWLGQLEELKELDLSHNSFSGPIPEGLGNLSSLINLILESNELNGNLPDNLGHLFNLETLAVSKNSLTGIVSERNLRSLTNLKSFSMGSPALVYDFDPEWVPPFQLVSISLGYVRDKLPAWLFTQSSLTDLKILDSTASFEPLDKFWNFATQLEYFVLVNSTINGDISNVLLSSKLVWLDSNNLRGGMPRISPEVRVLRIYNNSLSGSISPLLCDSMKNKSNLVHLDMGYNHLTGELTDCWNDWKSLVHIDLGYNNLTGKIPHSMGSLSNLRFLYLESNKFFGEVPFSLNNCKNLWILDLGHNNLSGVIPNWLGQSVRGLKLRSNQFSGNIPTQLCQLGSLMVMDFASNRLSGPIPNCLHNFTAMLFSNASTYKVGFTVQSPDFSVSIACGIRMFIKGKELNRVYLMNDIDLSNNNLSGSVPLEIYMLTGLQSLNLSHNQLMGTIPQEIGNLKQLEAIDLSRNQFSGEIPVSLSALHYLSVLNLSFNNLMGKIPSGTQLGSTDLSYIGNSDLCGPPLTKICPQDEKSHNITKPVREEDDDDDKSEVYSWFYMGMGIGFAVGFWGVFGTILFNRRCRRVYFRFLHRVFKDHRRCSYMIANALDEDGKFTAAQVSRKLKQLGLSLPQKSSGGKMHPKDADLMDLSNDRMDESDDETLVTLIKRKKMENDKLSRGQLHGQISEDRLSTDDSDDEMLSSVLKRTRRSSLKSKQVELENIQIQESIMGDDSFNEGKTDVLERDNRVDSMNSSQIEHQQMDDLADSEDEVAVSAFPDNARSRRQLRMIHCNEKDMNTLLRFKTGVTDPSGVLSSWFPKLDCCQWTGVKCDNITGRVTHLNLPCHTTQPKVVSLDEKDDKSHCLTGEFSLTLLELEFLWYLDFSNNDFKSIQYNSMGSQKCDQLSRGNLPHLCRNSTNLRLLDLSLNYDLLVDNLHWISRLSSLQYLSLEGVHLHKEIDWLQSVTMLPSLIELHLQRCQLENIYPFLQYANFTSLQALKLSGNDFESELPSWLFNLSCDISYIDLSQNKIHSQLPKTLPNLRRVKFLTLSQNYLKGPIPNWLGQLEQLQGLDLSDNFFSGPIPASLGNLSSLTTLVLDSNELNENLPDNLWHLFNLERLSILKNSLTGIVSERNLLSFSKLRWFAMSSPGLIFDFDPEWVPPFQLQHLTLGYVRDKLPAWLFTQSSLKYLIIEDSTASFEPLDKFWNFATQLKYFYLVNNTINGDISNVLLSSEHVWLASNNLRGGIPRISPDVVALTLYNNSLSGSISPLLCDSMKNKSNLVHLDMGYNHLTGELTDCWNDWKSLVHIDLGYNNLTGKIPHSMGSLSNLRFLYLESNKFFGEVPFSLNNCKNLWILDLGHNNLSGVIPNWLGQSVRGLKLRSNQFSGNIPTQLCQLGSLMVMDFASNRLSGPIPNCLHNFTAMLFSNASTLKVGFIVHLPGFPLIITCGITMLIKGNELEYMNFMNVIDLSNNILSGSVPLEIYMLTGLQSLNLSHNQLLGTIPQEIGNLKQLEAIDLSRNQFSGEIPESMAVLHYLSVLNLSLNNFVGEIPTGTQLGSTNLSYIGNPHLCGAPLTKICPQDEKSNNTKHAGEEDDDDKSELYSWFYMGLGIGFAVGFLGVLGAIFFNRRCRHAYFRFLHRILKIHCNEKDMNTLLRFKKGVRDPSGMLSSWFPKLDCCRWTGVKCDNITGRVTQLNLPCHTTQPEVVAYQEKDDKSHCLTGEFSLTLLELEFLSYLDFSNNDFKSIQYSSMGNHKCDDLSRGNLPHLCGNSTNLHYLDLSHNYDLLVYNLHWVSRLSSLKYLNLGGVRLPKEIDWLQSVTMLPSLLELTLENCQLENIYPFLQYANFTSLQILNLAGNDFVSELPSWLFNLSCDISHIDLSQNRINSQLPERFPNFRSIQTLFLSDNYLKGPIPNWLGQLEELKELDLSHNSFSGPIPEGLGNLSSLINLILESNELKGNLPDNLGHLFNLETLAVSKNSLTGIVSERNLRSLTNLKSFSMGSPSLVYDFDPEWVPPFQLVSISLGYVRDKLPAWLFTQSSLTDLKILDSTASFEPLDKFWNFATQLEYFVLVNSTINGDISNVLLSSKLVWLDSNNLRGGMPRISPEVRVLRIYNNSLSGSISPLLCDNMKNKSNLVYLGMGYNHFSGELTDCWNNWKSLVLIDFGYNNLTGNIPHSMGSLSNLRFVYLESNKLFGEVPFSLKNCQNLWILDIGDNNLSGVIPSWWGQSVRGLKLRSNQFSGNIPTQLCQLGSLMVMDFASNRLSGPIPNCLHNFTAMLFSNASTYKVGFTVQSPDFSVSIACGIRMFIKGKELNRVYLMNDIDLSNNNLSGSVPLEIYMLTGLQSLNLSHNQLMGTIPQEIGNLKQLEAIDLSRNQFSGEIPVSLSALHYLSVLNLSFNNLMGKIPSGTQLGSTDLSYIGNSDLCGPPLTKICPQDEKSHSITKPVREEDDDDDKSEVYSWFYMGMGIGFAVGFWGVFGTILFNRRCRLVYFRFLHRVCDFVIRKMISIY